MEKNVLTDRIIYILAFIGFFGTGGYLLFSSNEIARNLSNSSVFGSVRPIGNDVRLRGYEEAVWNRVERLEKVYRNDRVYTGSKSSAEVVLKNNQKFTVEPNSLIKITDQEESTLFNVQNGSFFADLKKGARFLLQSGDKTTEIKSEGALVRIESDKDKIKLVVLKGEAMAVASNGDSTAIKANEEAEIEPEKIKVTELKINLKTPLPGNVEWSNGQPTKFTWETSEPKQVRFEIATEPSFENVVVEKSLNKNDIEVALPLGQVYFWRVSEEGQQRHRSPVSSFSLYKILPPVLNPNVVENNNQLTFTWNDPILSKDYELQTSLDADFSKIDQSIVSETTTAVLPRLHSGDYHWRVVSRHPTRADAASSVLTLVTERRLASLTEAPLGTATLSQKEFLFELADKDDRPSLSYQKAEQATSHQLELSYYEDFKHSFLIENLKDDQWVWSKPQAGLFYARVKASRGKEDTYSPVSKLRVIVAAPVFKDFKLTGKPNKPQRLNIRLQAHPLSNSVEVQVADNENFTSANVKRIKSDVLQALIKDPGTKYVRARSLNADNWPISRYSDVKQFTITPIVQEEIRVEKLAEKPAETKVEQPLAIKRQQEETFKPRFGIWSGFGMNYLMFNQKGDSTSDLDSGGFAKLTIPTISFGGNFQWNAQQAVDFQYHDWPGQLSGPSSASIDNDKYHLLSMSAEYQHRLLKSKEQQTFLTIGYNISQAPFLAVNENGDNLMHTNELQSALLGAKIKLLAKEGIEYEGAFRYYLLTSSKNLNSASFKAQMGPMMDASIGVSRSYDNGLRFGLYWLLQYQDYNYKFNMNGINTTGNQNFINSNFQFRIGYDFFGLTILPMFAKRRRKNKKPS